MEVEQVLSMEGGVGDESYAHNSSLQHQDRVIKPKAQRVMAMKVEEVLSMGGGVGEASYTRNSSFQKTAMIKVGPLLKESIQALCSKTSPRGLTIADYGCSSGPNALFLLRSVIDTVVSTCQNSSIRIPEFNVFMNDLPRNDFNTIFMSIPDFRRKIEEEKDIELSCCISGTPGSFYNKLFPSNLIHFMHSSYSLHWLSRVPTELIGGNGEEAPNKEYIYARKGCPLEVLKAYGNQFANDFTTFLRCRSKEIIHGGRVVLSFRGSHEGEPCPALELIGKSLKKLAYEGLINKEKLEVFNMPYCTPTAQQVRQLVEAEGSFIFHHLDTFTVPWYATASEVDAPDRTAAAGTMRAIFQPLLAKEFGEEVMGALFCSIEEMIGSNLDAGEGAGFVTHAISLIRRG